MFTDKLNDLFEKYMPTITFLGDVIIPLVALIVPGIWGYYKIRKKKKEADPQKTYYTDKEPKDANKGDVWISGSDADFDFGDEDGEEDQIFDFGDEDK